MTALVASSGGFSWNLFSDLHEQLSYQFMRNAYLAGGVVALVGGIVGYFVLLRRSAFAAHALSHIGFAGAAGAVALDVNPLYGLLAFCLTAGAVIGGLGQRLRDRDTVIGIVLAFSLGLGALFLSLYQGNDANEATSILFGQILGISNSDVVLTAAIGAVTLALVAVMYRPLLFASVDEDVARARGVPVGALSVAFMMTVALAVAIAVQVVGVLLIFALLVAPPAVAERLTPSPGRAMAVGAAVGLLSVWVGLFVGYWFAYPVSFFITTIAFGIYVAVRVTQYLLARRSLTGAKTTPLTGTPA
ncbi:MAG TPA: metal ABC transporter permease [Acidimicrobiales bacterium]|nr:metal ABC transporter permease [Acidimicrobiales bacterium]